MKNLAEPAAARAGSTEPAVARVREFSPVRSVPLDVPPHTFLGRSSNTADPLSRTPGGKSHSGIRDGPSSAVISSHWRGTLPDREGLWTGAHPEKLVSFTAFRESYLYLLCDISTSDLFDTSRVIQLVATLFSRTTTRQRRQSPHDWAVDAMRDAIRDGNPLCWMSLMTAVRRRWPDWVQRLLPLVWISPVVYQVRVSGLGFTGIKDWQRRGGWVGGIGRLVEFIEHGPLFSLTGSLA
ncbi:BQ5605_C021g09231 [Microbotryum silenes-dioicae]|uniref:BQ5605_C021g09231 protein n=1 Tax=Microbotryum silenes-dioicae TaxID=796604 RepID=A0A2X0PDY4_9BASI|nr:BQ5605_C021g09231 [Microbotryum silenes-dioicae]